MTIKKLKNKYYLNDKTNLYEIYENIDLDEKDTYLSNSLLHIACNFYDSKAVEILLNRGINPNILNDNSDTPLHILFLGEEDFYNKEELINCINLLLDKKASVMRKNIDSKTSPLLATEKGEYEAIKIFIDKKLKLNIKDKEGNTLLHIACQNIYDKKEKEYIEIIKILINNGFDLEEKNENNETALDIAINRDNKNLLNILQKDSTQEIDLCKLIETKNYELVDEITSNSFELNDEIYDSNDFKGMSYLGLACYLLDYKMVEILIKNGANPNFKNSNGKTAISNCLGNNSDIYFENKENIIKILKILFENGLDIDDTIDDLGNTGLIRACKYIDKNKSINGMTLSGIIANYFLEKNCDIDKTNLNGETALMFVCSGFRDENTDIQLQLLEQGVNIASIDKNGNTPLIYTALNRNHANSVQMAELLFDFGDPLLEHTNNDNKNVLEIATENNNESLVNLLLSRL